MLSGANLAAMEAERMFHIVGAKLKQLPKDCREEVLDPRRLGALDADGVRVQEVMHLGRRIVVSHSPKRAGKDARDRERILSKLRVRLERSANPKELLGSRGHHRFLRLEGKAKWGRRSAPNVVPFRVSAQFKTITYTNKPSKSGPDCKKRR